MLKFIVKYKTQEWTGSKYKYPEKYKILTFNKLDQVTNENIENELGDKFIEVLELKQING